MKKLLYLSLLASALLAAGCAKEAAPSYQGDGSKKITVMANTEIPVSSKATVSDEGVISWSEGDQIGVWDEGQSKQLQFSYVKGSSKSFEGSVAESSNLTFAVAPYNEGNYFVTGNTTVTATVVLPNSYSDYIPGTETTSGTTNAPMLAKGKTLEGDNYTFDFKHTAALVKVTYENVPVGTASFELYADQVIAGTYDLDFDLSKDEEEPILKNASGTTSKAVTFYLKEAVTELNQTLSFYVPVPAGQYTYFRTILYDAGANMISGTGRQLTLPSNEQTFTRAEMLILPTIKLAEAKAGSKYSWTLASNDISSSGTQVSKGTPELSWTPEYSDGSIGNLNKDKGLQVGTSSKPCTSLSLTTSGYTDYIENVIVNFSTANDGTAKVSVKVGGKDLYYGSATQADGTTSATSYAFKASELLSGDVVITFTNTAKAFYIKSIEINGDPRTAQPLSFSSSSVTAVLGETFTEPELSGAQTTVTYSSSNTDVATVDASTGKVSLIGVGTTTITATAEATEDYQESSASYTLSVPYTNIAAMKAAMSATSGTYAVKLDNAIVTYVYSASTKSVAYIEDASAGIKIYGTTASSLTEGTTYSGILTCEAKIYSGTYEITTFSADGLTAGTGTVSATEFTISDLESAFDENEGRRVKVKGLTVASVNNKTVNIDGSEIVLYSNDATFVSSLSAGDVVTVEGYPTIYSSTKEIKFYTNSDITVTGGAGVISITGQPASVNVDSEVQFSVSINSGAAISVSSSDESKATVSYDSSTGKATLKGVGEGTATITVSAPAINDFTAASKSFDVTINAKGSETEVTIDLTAQGYKDQQEVSSVRSEDKTVRLEFDKGTGSIVPIYYTSGTAARVYAGGTIKVSSTGTITKVVFTWNSTNKPSSADVADKGTYDTSTSTWTGSESEFTLTRPTGKGNWQLQKIVVTQSGAEAATSYSITLGSVSNGSISADKTSAYKGETVTLSATPDDGYTLDSWTVTDVDGNAVTVTDNAFTMPASNVSVSATFKVKDTSEKEVTFTAGTDKSSSTSITKEKVTITVSNGTFSRDDNYRVYKGATITISVPEGGKITKIEFTCTTSGTNQYGPGCLKLSSAAGTYSYSDKVGTWTVGETSTNSVTLTASGNQVRATQIVVNYFE